MRILNNTLIFLPKENTQCHASFVLPKHDGGVLAVWFQGTKEGADDVCIFGAEMDAQGHFDTPRRLSPADGVPHWNPVLFEGKGGETLLFYKAGKPIANWHTELMRDPKGGLNFCAPSPLVPGDVGGRGPVRNKILRLSDGSLLAPASTERGRWVCFFDRSKDEGATWMRTDDLALPEGGIIQPSLWEDERHIVHALMRSDRGVLYRTDSQDFGRTFCPPYPTDIPNNNSGIDLCRTEDGTLYLCCNPVTGNWAARSPLSLFVSKDNGATFTLLSHLITQAGEFSYPSIQYRNGLLHITHTEDRRSIRYWCIKP